MTVLAALHLLFYSMAQAIHLYRDPNGDKVFGEPATNHLPTISGGTGPGMNIGRIASTAESSTLRQQVDELEEALRERDAVIAQFQQKSSFHTSMTVM